MTVALAKVPPGGKHAPDTEAEVIRLYNAGFSREQIAEQTGCGKTTIGAILKRNNVPLRLVRGVHDAAKEDEVIRLYLANLSRRKITEQTGVPNATITHILKRRGVDRSRGRPAATPRDVVEAICRLFLAGSSYRDIANELGLTSGAVAGIIHRNGVKRDQALTAANIKRAAVTRAPRPKRPPAPKLVAVATEDDTRVRFVPEAEAPTSVDEVVISGASDAVMALKTLSCRWPIGDVQDADFHFCCRLRSYPSPYCDGHRKVAFQPKAKSAAARTEIVKTVRRYA